jgi:hypothetical protein
LPIRTRLLSALLAAACLGIAAPAQAQTDPLADLDILADASTDPAMGLSLARDQYGEGDLTGAVATLERVLMDHPESDAALLFHAALLCRLDDKEGAQLELAELGRFGISDQAWKDVTEACGPMRRPGRSAG